MKKIGYLHQYFCKPSMNGGIRSYEFAKRLAEDGYDVHVITTDRENSFKGWREESLDGFTIHWVSVQYDNSFGFIARILAFFKFSILAWLKLWRIKPQLNFATSTPLTIAIPAILAKLFFGIPYIFEVRDLWPDAPIKMGFLKHPVLIWLARKLEYYAYSCANHVIALSPEMAKGVQAAGIEQSKITVIPNASDVALLRHSYDNQAQQFWQDKPLDPVQDQIVVYTGTIGVVNDLMYLVDLASSSLLYPQIKFAVFGQGAEKQKIMDYAASKQVLNQNLFFFDPVPKQQLAYILAGAKMTMSLVADIPALWGNSANKFFDSFAATKPIMINHGGWQADVIQEYKCGLVVGRDTTQASQSIYQMLNNSAALQYAGEQSRYLGDCVFGRDVLYQKFKQIFDQNIKNQEPSHV